MPKLDLFVRCVVLLGIGVIALAVVLAMKR
jgi:hypothetical protein